MDQKFLKYFANNWQPEYEKYVYSGWQLLNRIPKHSNILDVGCGYNLLKPHFPNLYGIDPANTLADEVTSIEDYVSDRKWDYVLCLGSLNFGDTSTVEPQVAKVVDLCKSDGYIIWRQNPGVGDHPWEGVEVVKFFPWSFEYNYFWAAKYKCSITECKWDTGHRIYSEWKKI